MPLPRLELETSGFDTILNCMHQPIQPKSPKSLSFLGRGGQSTNTSQHNRVSTRIICYSNQPLQYTVSYKISLYSESATPNQPTVQPRCHQKIQDSDSFGTYTVDLVISFSSSLLESC